MVANSLRHSYQFTLVYTDVTYHLSVLGPSTEVVWTEKVEPGTNIESLMTEGKLASTTAGVGIPRHANHIKAQSAGRPSGKGAVVWI